MIFRVAKRMIFRTPLLQETHMIDLMFNALCCHYELTNILLDKDRISIYFIDNDRNLVRSCSVEQEDSLMCDIWSTIMVRWNDESGKVPSRTQER
jgi:hypothetical protein